MPCWALYSSSRYFYPRSPCGERRVNLMFAKSLFSISIHALLAESDGPVTKGDKDQVVISIHALLAESDVTGFDSGTMVPAFLSTLSLRRATVPRTKSVVKHGKFLSTLSLRRATTRHCIKLRKSRRFLSTLSLRRATSAPTGKWAGCNHFYPRSPCGERPRSAGPWQAECRDFYPRSPCGERPRTPTTVVTLICISIHALLAESDQCGLSALQHTLLFLSTLSLRRATSAWQ